MTAAVFVGRVGGLAAALGAGAAIALAAASPASADNSTSPDAASLPSAAQQSARAGAAGAGRPAAASAARGGHGPAEAGTPVRPAAVVSASPVVRSAAVPATAPIPVRVAIARPSAAQAGEPTPVQSPAPPTPVAAPASTADTPTAASLGSLFDPRGRRVTVFEGVHFVTPQSWAFFVKQVSGTGTFTPDSVYDLKDADQYDWNKFTGIAFSPLQHDRNSAMVGWRYNLTTQEFEIAPFYNVNKERILPNEKTEVISVPADGTFQYKVDYSGVTISYGDQTVFKPYPPGLTPTVWTATRVSGWFGGNEVAPRKLTYYLKLR